MVSVRGAGDSGRGVVASVYASGSNRNAVCGTAVPLNGSEFCSERRWHRDAARDDPNLPRLKREVFASHGSRDVAHLVFSADEFLDVQVVFSLPLLPPSRLLRPRRGQVVGSGPQELMPLGARRSIMGRLPSCSRVAPTPVAFTSTKRDASTSCVG